MTLANHQISVAHRGITCAAFCVMAFFGPERSLAWFAPLLLFYGMADGVLAIAAAARAAYAREWWACYLVEGLSGVGGVVAIALWPGLSLQAIAWGAVFWAGINALGALVTVARLRTITRDWLLATAGLALLRFAVLAVGCAKAGQPAIARWSAATAFVFAALFLALAFWRRAGAGRRMVGQRA